MGSTHVIYLTLSTTLLLVIVPLPVNGKRNASGICELIGSSTNSDELKNRILLLPSNQDFDKKTFNGFLYFFLMLYMFLGISIASHIFMCSIEVIVSKTKTATITKTEDGVQVTEKKRVKIWNETIANLTLMALGSSAPEILLSIIETVGNDFCAGALGPGTIVGSASYNLLIITAVCIVSVPNDTTKRIKEYKVFLTTSVFAVIAYVWMVVILQVISQKYVEIWEAVLTLSFFPIMVGLAFWAEMDFCTKGRSQKRKSVTSTIHDPSIQALDAAEAAQPLFHFYDEWDNLVDETGALNHETVKTLYRELQQIAVLTDEEISSIISAKLIQSKGHSVLWYKIRAIQALVAGNKTQPALTDKLKEVMDVLNDMKRNETGRRGELRPVITSPDTFKKKAVIEFNANCMAIPVFVGTFTILVKRLGREDVTVLAKLESYDGSAKKGVSYIEVCKEVIFEPYVVEQKIPIQVIGDGHQNRDSNFFLRISLGQSDPTKVAIGPMSVMEVVIMDIDQPGEVQFAKKGMVVRDTLRFADIDVERVNGADGLLTAKWRARPGPKCTRLPEEIEGSIQFEHGEMKKVLEIPLHEGGPRAAGDVEQFDVEIYEITSGGTIGKNPIITVAVSADDHFKLKITRIADAAEEQADGCGIIRQSYVEQIKSAYIVNGNLQEAKTASKLDKVMHVIGLPWKMLMCFLPTPYFLGGWPCFVLTLAVLGLLTAIVGDMATIFGYCMSLDPVTTAITFVAIGTSLPDTFASRIAALQDKTADNAIGNITGSNSVNVFLGLGLPWTIASIYTSVNYPNQRLQVNAESLAFVVTIYTIAALIAQFILWLRRQSMTFGFAELGGPTGTKWLTSSFLVMCWFSYVFFSILLTQNAFGLGVIATLLAEQLKIS